MKFEPGKKSGKLDKMSMPKRKSPLDDVAVMELEMEPKSEDDSEGPSDEEGADEADMSNELAGESEGETDGPLGDASDEDLLAEVRKRGLTAKADKASGDEPTADDEY